MPISKQAAHERALKAAATRKRNKALGIAPKPKPTPKPTSTPKRKARRKQDISDFARMDSRDVWYVSERFAGQKEASKRGHALARRFQHVGVPYAVTTHRDGAGWHTVIFLNLKDARARGLIG